MTRHALNWALALALVGLISAMQVLDGPDDIETDRAIAADLQDAQTQAQAPAQAQTQAQTHSLAQLKEVQP